MVTCNQPWHGLPGTPQVRVIGPNQLSRIHGGVQSQAGVGHWTLNTCYCVVSGNKIKKVALKDRFHSVLLGGPCHLFEHHTMFSSQDSLFIQLHTSECVSSPHSHCKYQHSQCEFLHIAPLNNPTPTFVPFVMCLYISRGMSRVSCRGTNVLKLNLSMLS